MPISFKPEHRAVDDRLPVDRVGDGLPDPHIIKRGHHVVGRQDRFTLGIAHENLEPGIGIELREVLRRGEACEYVDILGHHRGEGCCRVRDEAEGRLAQRRGLAPVALVGGKFYPVALDPFVELEGAGADRVRGDRLDAFGGHDHRIAPCHVEKERTVGLPKRHLHGRRIDDRHIGDPGEQALLGIRRIFCPGAVEAEFHVLGIHRRAVVEGHAVTQVEGVDKPVFRNLPAFGEAGDDRSVSHEAGQPLEDVGIEHAVDGLRGTARRIKVRRLELDRHGDVCLLGMGGASQ